MYRYINIYLNRVKPTAMDGAALLALAPRYRWGSWIYIYIYVYIYIHILVCIFTCFKYVHIYAYVYYVCIHMRPFVDMKTNPEFMK